MPDIYGAERNPDAMHKREAAVRAQHAASVLSRRRGDAARNVALLALSLGCGWLVYSNGELATKAASRDTVYAVVQRNGEVISSTHYADLPPNALPEESIQNTLWMYVQSRDCFGSFSPVRQYYMALAVSDERVGKQVKDQFLLTNAQAPQHIYGDHGVTVQCDLVDPPAPIGDPLNHQYLFRFRRWEQSVRSTPTDQAAAPFHRVAEGRFLGGRFAAGVEQQRKTARILHPGRNQPPAHQGEFPPALEMRTIGTGWVGAIL